MNLPSCRKRPKSAWHWRWVPHAQTWCYASIIVALVSLFLLAIASFPIVSSSYVACLSRLRPSLLCALQFARHDCIPPHWLPQITSLPWQLQVLHEANIWSPSSKVRIPSSCQVVVEILNDGRNLCVVETSADIIWMTHKTSPPVWNHPNRCAGIVEESSGEDVTHATRKKDHHGW